ncbi:MAG: deoxynucleoside kinase [Bacteroidales bacterium]|nr:deoxynucleoside kinase [Bacteroidales bacterium]MBR5831112.1 deoxynucleoside kinase [Bacteroidales bacterium]
MHIAVAGNIGSGKTTLTGLLAKHLGYEAVYENNSNNPYINSFYEDMRRWSFNLQIYFLHTRFKQIVDIKKSCANIVQDRTIYEDAYIFAPNLHAMGLMNTRDFENYQAIFELLSSFIQPPDLLIYLKGNVPALVNQIQRRGREYENSIRLDYLTSLNQRYENWISQYDKGKLLVIDIEELNFADKPEDLGVVIDKINAEINGLF